MGAGGRAALSGAGQGGGHGFGFYFSLRFMFTERGRGVRSGTNVIYELSRASTGESYGTFVFLKDLMVLFLITIIILLYFL